MTVTHNELVPFLLEQLPRYAVPERTFVSDELRVMSTGKRTHAPRAGRSGPLNNILINND